jgi:hypothetical protein
MLSARYEASGKELEGELVSPSIKKSNNENSLLSVFKD